MNKPLAKSTTKSILTPLWENVKRPTAISFYLVLLYKFISTFQVMALMLEVPASYFKSTEGSWWSIMTIPRVFIFRKKFNIDSSDPVSGTFFILCCIASLLNYFLLITGLIGRAMNLLKTETVALVLRHFMVFHQFVLFLPTQVFMLEVINASSKSGLFILGSQTSSSLLVAVAVIVLIFNFFSGLINLQCYSSLYAQKTFTKRNASLASLDLAFKAGFSTYIVFVPMTSYAKWIAIIMIMLYMTLSHVLFHIQLPFFKIKILEAYCVFLAGKAALTIVVFIVGIFDEFHTITVPDLPVAAFFFCFPLAIAGQFHFMFHTIIKAAILEETTSLKNENDVFVRLMAIRYILKKGSFKSLKTGRQQATQWRMQLKGVIWRHSMHCQNPVCGCKIFLEIEDGMKGIAHRREKFRDLKISLMRELYERGAESAKYSELLLLNLAQFYLLYLENYLRSYLVLQAFEKKAKNSFETEMLVEYLKKRIQEKMELKMSGGGVQQSLLIGEFEQNNLNVTAVVQNDIQFIQLKNLVHEQVNKQLKFWEMLENFELDTRQIEVCCEEIDSIRSKIEKLWEGLSKINHKCRNHYLLYGLYQSLMNNSSKKGERYLSDYGRMTGINAQEIDAITNDNLYDINTVIIRISMRRDKVGTIEECSGSVDTIFGYQISELLDTNVACIMSPFFKERHHNFIMNHFEKGTENALNRLKRLYGYHKDGFIFPIFLWVSIYPNLETGLSYMGIIRPRKVYNNYILVKHDGTVDSYSPEIAEYLGLESRKKYNIVELCPEFDKINNAFNYVTKKKYNNLNEDEGDVKDLHAKNSNEYQVKVNNLNNSRIAAPDSIVRFEGSSNPDNPSQFSDPEGTSEIVTNSKNGSLLESREQQPASPNRAFKEKNFLAVKTNGKKKSHARRLKRLNTEEQEEYSKIYDQLSINGSVLSFTLQKDRIENNTKNFHCTVADEIFDYSILRIITLGRNDENLAVSKETPNAAQNVNKRLFHSEGRKMTAPGFGKTDVGEMDIGISRIPRPEDLQLFRNPFNTEEEALNIRTEQEEDQRNGNNKKEILELLLPQQEVPESQVIISTGRMDLFDPSSQSRKFGSEVSDQDSNLQDQREEDDEKLEDSKGFIQGILNNGHDDKVELASTANTSQKSGGVIFKLESLFYKKEIKKSSNKLRAYYAVIVLCALLALIDLLLLSSNLNDAADRIEKAVPYGQRIDSVIHLNFLVRTLYMSVNGFIDDDRHLLDLGIPNYPEYLLSLLPGVTQNLVRTNTLILNDLDSLREGSEAMFFANQVELAYPAGSMSENNIQKLNSFEALNTMAAAALDLTAGTFADIPQKMDQVNFILLNSPNGVYTEMTKGYAIYKEDLKDNINSMRLTTWLITVSAFTSYILFFLLLVRDLANNHQDKIRFWNSLIKLDTSKSITCKKMLIIIKENLENASNESSLKRALLDIRRHEIRTVQVKKDKGNQQNVMKKLKSYKFQNRNQFIVLPFLVILAIILTYFIMTAVLVENQGDIKTVYLDEIVRASSYFQLNVVTLEGLYQLITEGEATKFLDMPVMDAVEMNLEQLSKLGDFLGSFEAKNGFDPRAFLQRNFCNDFNSSTQIATCNEIGRGINTQGLSGVMTFAKDVMDMVLDIVVSANGDPVIIASALDQENFLILEVEWVFLQNQFTQLVQNLADGHGREHSKFQTQSIVTLIVFIVLLFLLNYLLIWKGFERLHRQKFDNMKILRVLPISMILDSKMLKTYLLKSFRDDLSSIKNKL